MRTGSATRSGGSTGSRSGLRARSYAAGAGGRAAEVETIQAPPELNGLMEALRELAPNQRAAIVLRYVVDLDIAEIAQRMGIAQPTVRVHLHRARNRLKKLLGAEEVE